MELAAIYRLSEDDVPGASLSGKSPDVLSVEQLKRWLACRGARRSGKKAELVQRVKEYVRMGLDKNIIDPDKGANIARKLERLQQSGVNEVAHPNLRSSPTPPKEGWTSNLAELPFVSFASLYRHFVERPTNVILLADDADQSLSAEESAADGSGDECLPSFRGLGKGYRFFKDGHVQSIQHHSLPDSPGLCYVRAQVLPSMVKTKKYSVKLCLTDKGDVHTAYCVCPAGLAGCCNHVAALLYALEEFVRLGMREESKLPCTSRLQQWNRPRCRSVPPRRVIDVAVIKEEYGKQKRRKVRPVYDPRPLNLRVPKPEEQAALLVALQKEHEDQLRSDTTGNVMKYGSSCLLKLMDPSSSESSSASDIDSDNSSESDIELDAAVETTASATTPDEFYKKNVELTVEGAVALEVETRGQSRTNSWFLARRLRVTASMSKDIAARRKKDFAPVVRRHMSGQFRGNRATRYGQEHEKVALECFAKSFTAADVEVMEPGLVVDSSEPWLGASPDGIITVNGEKYLVEVKCPYSARDMTVEEALRNIKAFCLSKEGDKPTLRLKHSHRYFYQVQVQLHVCKLTKCYFVVWTLKDLFSTTIRIDCEFLQTILPKLRSYYFQELLPALTSESL